MYHPITTIVSVCTLYSLLGLYFSLLYSSGSELPLQLFIVVRIINESSREMIYSKLQQRVNIFLHFLRKQLAIVAWFKYGEKTYELTKDRQVENCRQRSSRHIFLFPHSEIDPYQRFEVFEQILLCTWFPIVQVLHGHMGLIPALLSNSS
jgi:hypothetical protein